MGDDLYILTIEDGLRILANDELMIWQIEDDLNFFLNGMWTQFSNKYAFNLFLVTASFQLKTFLGFAQLSNICPICLLDWYWLLGGYFKIRIVLIS